MAKNKEWNVIRFLLRFVFEQACKKNFTEIVVALQFNDLK
jgi:hypothetical protein